MKLEGHVDSDWASSLDDAKSTSGFCFSLGSGMFCWSSKKQSVVAQSTAEAEYVAAAHATNQAIWIRKVLLELNFNPSSSTVIHCDSKSAIAISENLVYFGRTKHILVKFHAIRERVKNGEVRLVHCKSEEQIADGFTKPLATAKFEEFKFKIGVMSNCIKGSV